jgi:hypothetical protein
MGRANLERFLVAAQDDAVLAAWAKVIDDYKIGAHAEVPPNEHWESFQDFFSHGLVSAIHFDSTNVKRVFFSGERPTQGDVQSVLDNIQLLCPEHIQEEPMNKAKPPIAAFSNESSITRRESNGLAASPSRNELRTRRPPSGLAAFQPQPNAMAPAQQPAGLQAFQQAPPAQQPAGLQCTSVDSGLYVGGVELNGHIVCCGQTLQIVEEGGDIIPAEDLPHSEEFALLEYMFHSECGNCQTVYHTSATKPIPRENY